MADETSRIVQGILESMSGYLIEEIGQWQAELEVQLAREAYEEITFLAHKIRGTASVLSWEPLSERCRQLEEAARRGRRAETAALVSEVNDCLASCVKLVPTVE